MARPRGGDWLVDELSRFRRDGVDVVVSLLEAAEARELDLDREAAACREANIEFVSFPIRDRDVPESARALLELVRNLGGQLEASRSLAIHCRAGIGRASLLAATLLAAGGIDVSEAFARIAAARGLSVPDTPDQVGWVETFASHWLR
ncbi:MAG: tyrosine protein phosphatase [Proteobacteria bacterium]|nr:tyrosine protein phosphatase [Pseudomonadota bacterium]